MMSGTGAGGLRSTSGRCLATAGGSASAGMAGVGVSALTIVAELAEPRVSALTVVVGWGAPVLTALVWVGAVAQPQASTTQAVNRIRDTAMLSNDISSKPAAESAS